VLGEQTGSATMRDWARRELNGYAGRTRCRTTVTFPRRYLVGSPDARTGLMTAAWPGVYCVPHGDDRSASSPSTAAQTAIGEGIFALLEPISRWVAVRLVVELLVFPVPCHNSHTGSELVFSVHVRPLFGIR
jgi:hypothetical protein